jgi:hypothetical protein
MPHQHTITTYSYHELDEPAQAAALKNLRHINVDHDWWDFAYDTFMAALELLGFTVDRRKENGPNAHTYSRPQLHFSGFWSQGDGLSFTGLWNYDKAATAAVRKEFPTWTELHTAADELKRLAKSCFYTPTVHIWRINNYYVHPNTVSIHYAEYTHPNGYTYDIKEDIADGILDTFRYLMHEFYNMLEQQYEHLTSAEAVRETIELNEYEFTADGKLY